MPVPRTMEGLTLSHINSIYLGSTESSDACTGDAEHTQV